MTGELYSGFASATRMYKVHLGPSIIKLQILVLEA